MSKPLVSDELWELIEPILPKKKRRFRYAGRKAIDDRKVLTGIIFVLKTGIQWEHLPYEMGCGCGMTCWRRLRDWNNCGVWQKLHAVLLEKLDDADKIDWSRTLIDSASVRATRRGGKTGRNPTDRAKHGSKHHILTDAQGLILSMSLTGANRHDITQLKPLVETVPRLSHGPAAHGKQLHGKQLHGKQPQRVQGDRAYDSEPHREWLRRRKITPVLATRETPHGAGLGVFRWVVERSLSWLHNFRRLRIRDERRDDIHEAFLSLAAVLLNLNFLS